MTNLIDRVDPRIAFGLCLMAALGIMPFTVLHGLKGSYYVMLITMGINSMLLAVAWETWRSKKTPVRGLIASTAVGSVVVLLAIAHLKSAGIFWAFPYIVFSYYFLGTRSASWINLFFCPALFINVSTWAQGEVFYRIFAAVMLTWLFSVVFAVNNEKQRLELARLASSDPLTGTANRRALYQALERVAETFHRYKTPASVIVLDIDFFKKINDTHGHAVGDQVLIDLVTLLSQRLRKTDQLFRMGGEEFVVLLQQTPIEEANKVAESLRELVAASTLGTLCGITISSGLASLEESEDIHSWLSRADAALYRAKELGRNRVENATKLAA